MYPTYLQAIQYKYLATVYNTVAFIYFLYPAHYCFFHCMLCMFTELLIHFISYHFSIHVYKCMNIIIIVFLNAE